MVKNLFKWISRIFEPPLPFNKPKRDFCYWCHSKNCPHPDFEACKNSRFQCPDHEEGKIPSYCHGCCYSFTKPEDRIKPTLYKPDLNRYDSRMCLDWICEDCDRRYKERKDLWDRQNQDTAEAAELSFTKNGNEFFYYECPLKADFLLTYESLAPFVKRIHKIAAPNLEGGIEWEYISIREGRIYIHDELREYEEWDDND